MLLFVLGVSVFFALHNKPGDKWAYFAPTVACLTLRSQLTLSLQTLSSIKWAALLAIAAATLSPTCFMVTCFVVTRSRRTSRRSHGAIH